MKGMLFLSFCLAAGVSFGAYQYIVSTDPALTVNPSESTVSAAIAVNARAADEQALVAALETRYRTFAESNANTSILNRQKPGFSLTIR